MKFENEPETFRIDRARANTRFAPTKKIQIPKHEITPSATFYKSHGEANLVDCILSIGYTFWLMPGTENTANISVQLKMIDYSIRTKPHDIAEFYSCQSVQ